MNTTIIRILTSSFLFFLLSLGALGYVMFSQMAAGGRLVSFRESIDAWDILNRASVTLSNDGTEGTPVSEMLRSFVLRGEGDTIVFLSNLDDLGRQTGVAVSTSELKSVKTPEIGFDEIAATIALRGDPLRVDSLIALLENLPNRSRVESLTLTRLNGIAEAVVELRVSIVE